MNDQEPKDDEIQLFATQRLLGSRPAVRAHHVMWVGKIMARPPPYRVLPGKVRAREGYFFAGYLSYATITITIPFTSADASLVIVDE